MNDRAWSGRILAFVAAVLLLVAALPSAFALTAAQKDFDHLKTGFALTGRHVQVRCESCHQNGIFKGTPRDCASCHQSGQRFARGNVVMPPQHVPTTLACDACHTTRAFAGAKFNHAGVAPGSCQTCHNGTASAGKPSQHIATSASCDSCHRTTAWTPAGFDHAGVIAGSCANCHGSGRATGKSAQHIPTNQSCDDCHKGFAAWRPTAWNHTQMAVAGQCASCHSGGYPPADGRPSNHIPTVSVPAMATANCDTCHKGSFSSWANGRLHTSVNVTSGCASCHNGSFLNAVGKPNTPIHSSGVTACESCHSTSGWAAAKVDHGGFSAATNCATCHNGSTTSGKSSTHIPTTANCLACHAVSPASWKPSKWNHTQVPVAAVCASCHTGGYPPADGRPTNHIPYQTVPVTAAANCDGCHKGSYTTWANGALHANYSIATGCVSCHSGAYLNAVGKPANATHASVTGNCESCHKSTTTWSGAKVDHSGYTAATNCANCHNGSAASGKPGTHIPTTVNCYACHNVAPALWTPSKWNHTQQLVTAACASCHTGGYPPADGRPSNHIPYQTVAVTAAANCDGCHKGSTTTWANGALHANYSIATGCVSCHSGAYLNAVGKPANATHATVTGNCESCHKSTTTWSGAKVDHSGFTAATNCANCHNGSTATGKPGTHIPTTLNCVACHNVSPALWTPSKWNHTQQPVTAACAGCHTGGYPPADGRPGNHIPYQTVAVTAAANCDGCHKGSFATWANGALHANYSITTGCASCHSGAYLNAVGKPANATHATVTGNCESCHKSTTTWTGAKVDHSGFNAATNCASCHNGTSATGKPSTHIPTTVNCYACHNVSPALWTPSKWNHTQQPVAAACASCHTGGYPPADGRPTNHIPYQTVPVTAAANCDGCHKGSTTTWANGALHANFSITTGCKSCHSGAYLNARGKPSNHIPEVQLLNGATMDCNACHTAVSSWLSMKMNHNASLGNGAGWCKACHQSGTAWLGTMQKKSLTHEKSTGVTDCSQSGCHRPLGVRGNPYTSW